MRIFILLPFLSFAPLLAQDPAKPDAPAERQALPYQTDISNLPLEKRQQLFTHLVDAQSYFQQKRIFESLESLELLSDIYDKEPKSLNIKGACYVEFRNFAKARACFNKALKSLPDDPNVLFNLAEIAFVTHDWKSAHDQLSSIVEKFKDNNKAMYDIVRFKLLLSKLKLDDYEGAKKIVDSTDFLDDSPLHFYGKAALAYSKEENTDAEAWLARAGRIFRNPQLTAPWQDTLIEFGYIKSFYGGDLEINQDE